MRGFEVQVWTASVLDVRPEGWAALADVLDSAEQARSLQFRFAEDRQAYVLAHALRRHALGQALGVEPSALAFSSSDQGKPVLTAPSRPEVFFSHSHTRGQVAFALSFDRPVGIDVETVQPDSADPSLLDEFVLRPKTEICSRGQFYFYWTALEAFWKADGAGLSAMNQKIMLRPGKAGSHEVTLAGCDRASASACVIPVRVASGSSASLAVSYGLTQAPGKEHARVRTGRFRISEKAHFFGCKRRALRSSLTTIVSD
jgi:phosphopantetheinyl transferase